MIEKLEQLDRELLLLLNDMQIESMNQIWFVISSHEFWIPFFVLIVVLFIVKLKKYAWIPIVLLILLFASTDFVTNTVKHFFERYRPTHNLEIKDYVNIINNYRGGMYGFFSGHTSNSFSIALFSSLVVKKKWFTLFIFLWAIIVSYSRIYLGVHYPSDIICGLCYGLFAGYVFYLIHKILLKYISKGEIDKK